MPNTPDEPGHDADAEQEDFDIAQDRYYYDNSSYFFPGIAMDHNYSGERG